MNTKIAALIAGVALVGGASVYTIDAREVAVVTLFGGPVATITEPGLHTRLPWPLHQVIRFDKRTQVLSIEPTEMLTKEGENVVVEAYVAWRIEDPLLFLESIGRIEAANGKLTGPVVSQVAAAMGQIEYSELFTAAESGEDTATGRPLLSDTVRKDVASEARMRFGVEIQDLRIQHIGLPLQNEQSIYE